MKPLFSKLINAALFVLMLLPTWVCAASASYTQIKSAYIYRFANYLTWPEDDKISQYHIGFLGADDSLYQEMNKVVAMMKAKGRGFAIQRLQLNQFDPEAFHIIVVDQSQTQNVIAIANQLRRTGTLLITEESHAKRDFMINLHKMADNSIGFEVNRTNLVFEYLKMDKEILLLGGTELDVAELFRESEYSLAQQKQELIEKQKELQTLTNVLAKNLQQLNHQQKKIGSQQSRLSQQQSALAAKEKQIKDKESQLALTTSELGSASKKLTTGQQRLDEQLALLNQKEQQVAELSTLITENKQLLNKQINQLQQQQQNMQHNLQRQGSRIDKQKSTINLQQNLLLASITVLVVFVLLLLIILRIHRGRRLANQNLAASYANIATLSEIGKEISASLDVEKIQDTLYHHITQLMDAGSFGIGIYKPAQQLIDYKMSIEKGVRFKPFTRDMSDDNQFPVWCIKHKKEVFINDVTLEYQHYLDEYKEIGLLVDLTDGSKPLSPLSMIYLPILLKDEVLGVLTVQSFNRNAYSSHHLDMLRTLAAYTGTALDNAMAYRALHDTQRQLVTQEKMASLGTLTAGVAHEINNPTNFVHVSAQNLEVDLARFQQFLLDLAGDDAEEAVLDSFGQRFKPLYEHLATIKNGTERIKVIVQDLRAFTQIDCGTQKSANIVELLQSTINLVQTKHLELTTFVTDFQKVPELLCYPAQLNQVFMNLFVNACDAISERKQAQTQKYQGQIIITCQTENNDIVVTIKDNGNGMTQQTKDKIFEPFYTTKGVGEGTGLGLSISYGIVQQHQGELSVGSQLGVGTTFCLRLPMLDKELDKKN